MVQYAPALSAGGFLRLNRVPNFPEKRASRGPAIGPLQNIGSFVRFARKELGDFGITRRKIDARLQLRLEEVPRWNLYGRSTAAVSFRPSSGKENPQLLRLNVNQSLRQLR